MANMTPNSRKVLEFLKGNGVGAKFTNRDVMDALGFETQASVVGSINGLYKKNVVDKTKEKRTDSNGVEKEYTVFWLTEAGMNYDPDAQG